jgi:hypothetical protein
VLLEDGWQSNEGRTVRRLVRVQRILKERGLTLSLTAVRDMMKGNPMVLRTTKPEQVAWLILKHLEDGDE